MYSSYDSSGHSSDHMAKDAMVDESQRYFSAGPSSLNSSSSSVGHKVQFNSNTGKSCESNVSGHKKYTKINDGFILKSDQLTRLDLGHKGQYEHNGNRYSGVTSNCKGTSITNSTSNQYRTSTHSINNNSTYGYMLPPPIISSVNNTSDTGNNCTIGDENIYGYNSNSSGYGCGNPNDHTTTIYGTPSDHHLYSSLYETSKGHHHHEHATHHQVHGKYSSATSTPIAIPSGSGTMKHRRHGLSRSSPGTPLASVPHQLSTSSGQQQSYSLYSSPAYSASSTSKSTSYLVPPLGPTGRPVNGTSDVSLPSAVGGSATSTNVPLQLPPSSSHAMYGQITGHQRSGGHRTSSHYYVSGGGSADHHFDNQYGTVRHRTSQLTVYGSCAGSTRDKSTHSSSHEHTSNGSSKLRSVSRDRNSILSDVNCNPGQATYQSKSQASYLDQVPPAPADSIYESIDTLVNQLISQQQPLYSHLPKEAKIDHHQGYHHSSSSNYHPSSAYSSHAGSIYSTASDSILGNGHRDLVNTSNGSSTLSRRSRSTSRHRKSVTDDHSVSQMANLPNSSTSLHPEPIYNHKSDICSEINEFLYGSKSSNKSTGSGLYGQVMSTVNPSQATSIPDVLSNTGLIDSLTSTNLSLPSTSMTCNSIASSNSKYGYTSSKGKQQAQTYHQLQGSTADIQCHSQQQQQQQSHDGYNSYNHYSSNNYENSNEKVTSSGVNASIYATIKKTKSTPVTSATLSSLSVPSLDQVIMDFNRDSVYASASSHGDPMASASAVTSATSTTIQLPPPPPPAAATAPSVATVSSTPSSIVVGASLMSTPLTQSYVPLSQTERQQQSQQQQQQNQQQPLSSTCNSGHHHALGHTSASNRSSTSISFVTHSSPAESFSSSAESACDSSSESNSSSPSTPSTSPCSSRESSRSNSPDARHHTMSTSAHGLHHNFDPKSQFNHLTNYLSSALTSVKSSLKHPSLVNQFKQLKMTSMSAVINSIVNNVTPATDQENNNPNASPLTSITPINSSSPMSSNAPFAVPSTANMTSTTAHGGIVTPHDHMAKYGQVDSHHHGHHRHKHRSHHSGKEKTYQLPNYSLGYNASDYSTIAADASIDQPVNALNHTDHDQVMCNLINNEHHHNGASVSRKSRSKSSHRSSSSKFMSEGGEYTVKSIVDGQLSSGGDNDAHSSGQMAIDVLEAIQNQPSDCSSNSSYSCHNSNNCHHQSHNYHRRSNHQTHQPHNPSSDSSTSGYITGGATDHSGNSSNNGDDASVSGAVSKSNYHHQHDLHHHQIHSAAQSHRSTHYSQFNNHETPSASAAIQIDSQVHLQSQGKGSSSSGIEDDVSNLNAITIVDLPPPGNQLHVAPMTSGDEGRFGHRSRSKSREHLTSHSHSSKSSKHKRSRSKVKSSKKHHHKQGSHHGTSHHGESRRSHSKNGSHHRHQSKSSHRRHRHSSNQINCCIKYTLFSVNTLSWLIGFLLLMVGIWAWNEKDYFSNVFNVPVITLDPAFALMFIGLLTFAIGFIGSIGSLRENTTLLAVYSILLLILLFSELTLSIFAFAFKDWVSCKFFFNLALFLFTSRPSHC